MSRLPNLTATELYLAVCDHKWFRSEQLERDIGFAEGVVSFARLRRPPSWLGRLGDYLRTGWASVARGSPTAFG